MLRKTILSLIILGVASIPGTGFCQSAVTETRAAFQYLNDIRRQAGMIPFFENEILARSAMNHALYLNENRVISHFQATDRPYYTGKTPGDRAVYEGYELFNVTENFSSGQKNSLESIDGLMGAIYHRFGFLDFSKNEVGIALQRHKQGYTFVYNMGNRALNQFCRYAIDTKHGAYYQDMCRVTRHIPAETVDQLELTTMRENASIVVWPFQGASDVSPVFYEEIPDPLPNLSVSGYPISIQFNPAHYHDVAIHEFSLIEWDDGEPSEVRPVHLMHHRNDPNRKFTSLQFALFPLHRLKWGTRYQAEVEFETQDRRFKIDWTFKTKSIDVPLFVINGRGEVLNLTHNQTYAIHVPPSDRYPTIRNLNWEAPGTVHVNVTWEDKNTILLNLSGEPCHQVLFYLNDRREFSAQLADKSNLNDQQNYPKTSSLDCVLSATKKMQGFKISGQGEILQLQPGKTYWIEIDSPRHATATVKMHYSNQMQVQVKHLSRNMLKLSLDGKTGQSATFYLENEGYFKTILVD